MGRNLIMIGSIIFIFSIMNSKITMFEKVADEYFNNWQDEKDCSYSLKVFILRQRNKLEYPKKPNPCHLDPLLKECACGKTK